MRGGGKIFMLAGVGLALVAVLLLAMAFLGGGGGEQEEPVAAQQAQVTVIEAIRDIPAHTILTAEDLQEVPIAADAVPVDAVTSRSQVIGLAYRVPLTMGQRLLVAQVEQPGLGNIIQPGKRAVALPVGFINLFNGLIQDEDHVDIVFKARLNEVRLLGHSMGPTPEDGEYYEFKNGDGFGWLPVDFVDEFPPFPAAGDPGSQMYIRDDIGPNQQLEPIAKVLLQDIRVLRVVRPGERYAANGQLIEEPLSETGSTLGEEVQGTLVLEVTSQQAEVLSFMLDERAQPYNVYQVIVRGKEDHQVINTTGVTYEILATNDEYSLPLPGSVTIENGLPAPGNVVMPDELEEGDYRAGNVVELPEPETADEEPTDDEAQT
jgi:Flp pilus assembly protein CpaB